MSDSHSDQEFQDAENPLDDNLFLDEEEDEYEEEEHELEHGPNHGLDNDANHHNPSATAAVGVDAPYDPTYGFHIVASMNEAELDELIKLLEGECSILDNLSVNIRTKKIDWSKIFIGDYGPTECKAAWEFLRSNTRKFRNMAEVLQEIKLSCEKDKDKFRTRLIHSSPGFPKKPAANAAQMFTRFMWENNPEKRNFVKFSKKCIAAFENLPINEKSDWQFKSDVAKAEYEKCVKDYFSRYPNFALKLSKSNSKSIADLCLNYTGSGGKERKKVKPRAGGRAMSAQEFHLRYPDAPEVPSTPRLEFIQSRLNNLDPPPTSEDLPAYKQQFMEEFEALSEKKRYKWIKKCLKHCGEYLEALTEYESTHPDFIPLNAFKITNHMSKSEMDLWLKKNDWPKAPARSVSEQFIQDYLESGDYDALSVGERRCLAEAAYKKLDQTDKQLTQIDYRRKTLEYKKSIETHFAGTPEFLKPFIFSLIPKKYRDGLTLTVPKYSADVIEEDPNNEDDPVTEVNPLAPPPPYQEKTKVSEEPPAKRKKFAPMPNPPTKPLPHAQIHPDTDLDEVTIVPPPKPRGRRPLDQKGSRLPPAPAKPTPTQFQPQRPVSQKEIYDIIRGIFDGRSHLGHEYSAFYYYAKYVADDKVWIKIVWKEGLVKAAKKIFIVFNQLEEKDKKVFIDQSYQFYKETGNDLKKLMIEDKLDRGKLWELKYFPGEPIEPPRNATTLYCDEMLSLKRRFGHLVAPAWDELNTNIQKVYIRKYYQKVENYVKKYEEFVNKMTPNDLLTYIAYRNSLLEKYNISQPDVPKQNIGYGHPFSHCYMKQDDNVEAEDSEPEIVKSIPEKRSVKETNVLRNEDVIDKLRGVRVVKPINPVNEQQLLAEIQESDTEESSDSSGDESKIVWKNMRDYREQYDSARGKRYLKNLSKYTYDINGIPDVVEILPKAQVSNIPHGLTLSKVLDNAFKLEKAGNLATATAKKHVPKEFC